MGTSPQRKEGEEVSLLVFLEKKKGKEWEILKPREREKEVSHQPLGRACF